MSTFKILTKTKLEIIIMFKKLPTFLNQMMRVIHVRNQVTCVSSKVSIIKTLQPPESAISIIELHLKHNKTY